MSTNERDLIVGGQAVIEGVMMRTPNAYAIAVRKAGEAALRRRLEQATDLPSRYEPAALAALVHTISDGIAVQAVSGGDMRGHGDDSTAPDRAEAEDAVATLAALYDRFGLPPQRG